MSPLVFTDAAQSELADLVDYLGPRNPAALRSLLNAMERALGLVADGSMEGASVRLSDGEAARRCVVRHLIVYYRRTDSACEVLHVWDGRRSPLER